MTVFEILLLGVGLAMDAFAVSITKGLRMQQMQHREALVIALFFGGFQALMPSIGFFLGSRFLGLIEAYDHWVAFGLLAIIGGKNLIDSIREGKQQIEEVPLSTNPSGERYRLNLAELAFLAVATSIDALAVGITLAFVPSIHLLPSVLLIGGVTFLISYAGVAIGHAFGTRFQKAASIAGGLILIFIGVRILLEGLGVIG